MSISWGTLYGALTGLVLSSWIMVMAQYYKSQGVLVDVPKPTSTDGCLANATRNFTNQEETYEQYQPFFLFRISYYYYSPLGFAITMICGLLISCLIKNDDPPVHRDLLSPVIYFFLSDDTSEDY